MPRNTDLRLAVYVRRTTVSSWTGVQSEKKKREKEFSVSLITYLSEGDTTGTNGQVFARLKN